MSNRALPLRLLHKVKPKTWRRFMRMWPPSRNTGLRIDRISDDFREWDMRLPLEYRTRNLINTHFGGTLYSAADPHFMLAWIRILGPDYVVWDKAATIRFKRPGRGDLHGSIRISDGDIAYVKRRCEEEPKFDFTFTFEWKAEDGTVVAEVDKVLHFRKKREGDKGYDA